MFSDPQFWVAVAFVAFIVAIFNPVRKILTSSLDTQIKDIKNKNESVLQIQNQINEITKLTLSKVASFDVSDDEIKGAIKSTERSIN